MYDVWTYDTTYDLQNVKETLLRTLHILARRIPLHATVHKDYV